MPPSMTAGVHQLHSLSSSPMTLAFAERLKVGTPKFPSSVSVGDRFGAHWFAASLRPVELLAPLYGSDQAFPPANGDFYSRAFGESVALLVVGYNYDGN